MSTKSQTQSTETSVRKVRRYWQRTDSPRPWWPWGFVPILGLIVTFFFGAVILAPRIEAEVRTQVHENLGISNISADVRSDGQSVTVRTEAHDSERTLIHAVANSTQCDTWAGQLTCPTSVNLLIDEPEGAPAMLTRRPHQFAVVRTENAVTLSGEVPNLDEHNRILGVAEQRFSRVADELRITNEPATENYGHAADTALAVAGHLVSGRADWTNDVLTVNGTAKAGDVGTARTQFGDVGGGTFVGEFNVQVLDEQKRCNEGFQNLLTGSAVRFETGSANIGEGNEGILERIANLAGTCPGKLTIEGHTDSRGDAVMNEALSLARASAIGDALSELGVDTGRLVAIGFGESQPIADNATALGRAQNRRIAITISE